MRIPQALYDELVAHAQEDFPNECCGMIAARDGEAVRVHRVENSTPSPFGFVMDPMGQYRAQMAIEDDGLDLAAMYHSHTRSPAEPSQRDLNEAVRWWPDPLWVIVGLQDREAPSVRVWELVDSRFEERDLEVIPSASSAG